MRGSGILIRRYVRKRRGQIIALAILTAIAAALANLGYVLGVGYPDNLDRRAAAAHAADAMYVVPAGEAGTMFTQLVADDDRVTDSEVDDVLFGYATYTLGGEEVTTGVIVTALDAQPRLSQVRVVSEVTDPGAVSSPVWAAQILHTGGDYQLGDDVSFASGGNRVTLQIAGFTEDVYAMSPQLGAVSIAVPRADLAALEESGVFGPALAVKVNAGSSTDAVAALDAAVADVQDSALPDATGFASQWGQGLDLVRGGSTLGANIFAVAFLVFAGVIVAVALIVMRFVIKNLITADMTAIGAMRAVGFTTGALIVQLAATFGLTTLIAGLVGAGLSYLVLPGLSGALASQIGLTWEPGFSLPALGVSAGLLTLAIVVFAVLAALRIRRVTTVAALRGGIATHSFRTNRLPLDDTRGRVNGLLGLKSLTQRTSQNIVMALTIAVVAFASVFALGLTTNLLGNPAAFSRLVIGDVEDVGLTAAPGSDPGMLLDAARQTPGVDAAFYFHSEGTTLAGRAAVVQIADDFSVLRHDSTYEGRMPRHANEVSIGGRLADELGLTVGDTWTVELGDRSAEFLITGLTSSGRGLGYYAAFTTSGYERLDPAYVQEQIAIYLDDGVSPDEVIATLRSEHGSDILLAYNGQQNADAQLSGYLSMVSVLSVVIAIFTTVIVVLVVGLVVSTMIGQSRREMGVLKAVGFTSGDLSAQTMWSHLPVIAVGSAVGAAIGWITLNPVLGSLLGTVGVRRIDLTLTPWSVLALAVGVLVLAAAVIWLVTRRIGRISAYQLVSE